MDDITARMWGKIKFSPSSQSGGYYALECVKILILKNKHLIYFFKKTYSHSNE